MKKSFIIHTDSLSVVKKLTNEQAGLLLKAITSYQSGDELNLDNFTEIIFEPFLNQFKRDDEKYNKKVEINRLNGSSGGKQRQANASKRKQNQANQADSDSKSDSDSKIDNKSIHSFQKYILENCPNVFNMKIKLTNEQSVKLEDKYGFDLIINKLDAMENTPKIDKKYTSVYLTLNKWCSLEKKYVGVSSKKLFIHAVCSNQNGYFYPDPIPIEEWEGYKQKLANRPVPAIVVSFEQSDKSWR